MRSAEEYAEFARSRSPALLRTAWLLTGDPGAAEELVRSALAQTRLRWRRATRDGDPTQYARELLLRTYARRRAPVPPVSPESEPGVLAGLTPRARVLLVMQYYEHYTTSETAAVLGTTPASIHRQTTQALASLNASLNANAEANANADAEVEADADVEAEVDVEAVLADIPELPYPLDRLESVAGRIARIRRRRFAVAAAAVIALAGSALLVNRTANPPSDQCPTYRPEKQVPVVWSTETGPFVASGARSATLCVGGSNAPKGPMTLPLTRNVSTLVDALNALPLPEPGSYPGCNPLGLPTIRLMLRYPGRPDKIIDFDRDCGLVSDDRTVREDPDTAVNAFFDLYRDQVATRTDQRSLKPRRCAPSIDPRTLTGTDLRTRPGNAPPQDDIIRSGSDPIPLPERLAAAAFCDYTSSGGMLHLRHQAMTTKNLQSIHDGINITYGIPAFPPYQGPLPDCLDTPAKTAALTRLEVLWLIDATGRTFEARIARAPCTVLTSSQGGGLIPAPALLSDLDKRVG